TKVTARVRYAGSGCNVKAETTTRVIARCRASENGATRTRSGSISTRQNGRAKLTVSEGGRNVTALYPSGHFGRNHAGKEDDEEKGSAQEGSEEEKLEEEEVTLAGRRSPAEVKRAARKGCPFFPRAIQWAASAPTCSSNSVRWVSSSPSSSCWRCSSCSTSPSSCSLFRVAAKAAASCDGWTPAICRSRFRTPSRRLALACRAPRMRRSSRSSR